MSKYKAGDSIEIYEFLAGTNSVFYNITLNKAMHYEAFASLPLRIVFNWIKNGVIREAILMSKEELKIERKRIKDCKLKRKALVEQIRIDIKNSCNPEVVDVEFEDYY